MGEAKVTSKTPERIPQSGAIEVAPQTRVSDTESLSGSGNGSGVRA